MDENRRREPWFYGDGWRIGPFTFGEEASKEAEDTWKIIQQEQAAKKLEREQLNKPAFPSDPRLSIPIPGVGDPYLTGRDVYSGGPRDVENLPPVPDSPSIVDSAGEGLSSLWDMFKSIREAANKPDIGSMLPDVPGPPDPTLPEGAPIPQARPDPSVVVPDEAVIAAPPAQPEDIGSLKESLRQFFPQANTSTSKEQTAADAEMERQKKRTNLLAQLAFFSGITSAGGGQWKEVAKGFASAGEVYDDGFKRYHAALQDNADRAMKMRSEEYNREKDLTDAAIRLYATKKPTDTKEKDRRKEGMDFFKETKPDEFNEDAFADWKKRFQHFYETGEIIPEGVIDVR